MLASTVYAQMPDWTFFKDYVGNNYFINKAGKIVITEAEIKYDEVSIPGLEYCFAKAEMYYKSGYIGNSLRILKSMLLLPENDARVKAFRVKAEMFRKKIHNLNGDRYLHFDRESTPLIIRKSDSILLANDVMGYQIRLAGHVKILKNKWRLGTVLYNGFLAGVNIDSQVSKGYDYLLAIDSQRFSHPKIDIDDFVSDVQNRLLYDKLAKEELLRTDKRVEYLITHDGEKNLAGIETVVVKNNYGYILRIITTKDNFFKKSATIKSISENFMKDL